MNNLLPEFFDAIVHGRRTLVERARSLKLLSPTRSISLKWLVSDHVPLRF